MLLNKEKIVQKNCPTERNRKYSISYWLNDFNQLVADEIYYSDRLSDNLLTDRWTVMCN